MVLLVVGVSRSRRMEQPNPNVMLLLTNGWVLAVRLLIRRYLLVTTSEMS